MTWNNYNRKVFAERLQAAPSMRPARTLYQIPNRNQCLPRPVSCPNGEAHTPGSRRHMGPRVRLVPYGFRELLECLRAP